jgi:hypothetical protein
MRKHSLILFYGREGDLKAGARAPSNTMGGEAGSRKFTSDDE